MSTYRSVIVQMEDGVPQTNQVMLNINSIPENDLVIKVHYTAFSPADAHIMSGTFPGAVYPATPGVDAVGVVVKSNSAQFHPGDEVLVNGFDMGSRHPGGFSQYISVPESWVLHIPIGLTMKYAITLGSAAVAAGIAVSDFYRAGIRGGKVAVTGATSDSGALATALLSHLGYSVTAYVAECDNGEVYAKELGAKEIKKAAVLEKTTATLLEDPVYDAAFDNMGGTVLANLLKMMSSTAQIAVGSAFNATVSTSLAPFSYRGINVSGVNALSCPLQVKLDIWRKLAGEWRIPHTEWICTEISFKELDEHLPALLEGCTKGRLVINHGLT